MRKEYEIALKKIISHKGRDQEKKKGTEELQSSQKTINKMTVRTYLSIITLNLK